MIKDSNRFWFTNKQPHEIPTDTISMSGLKESQPKLHSFDGTPLASLHSVVDPWCFQKSLLYYYIRSLQCFPSLNDLHTKAKMIFSSSSLQHCKEEYIRVANYNH